VSDIAHRSRILLSDGFVSVVKTSQNFRNLLMHGLQNSTSGCFESVATTYMHRHRPTQLFNAVFHVYLSGPLKESLEIAGLVIFLQVKCPCSQLSQDWSEGRKRLKAETKSTATTERTKTLEVISVEQTIMSNRDWACMQLASIGLVQNESAKIINVCAYSLSPKRHWTELIFVIVVIVKAGTVIRPRIISTYMSRLYRSLIQMVSGPADQPRVFGATMHRTFTLTHPLIKEHVGLQQARLSDDQIQQLATAETSQLWICSNINVFTEKLTPVFLWLTMHHCNISVVL